MIARRQPTRPLRGLGATFNVTRGNNALVYNCRFCPARFQFQPIVGGLRAMAREERDLVYAHVGLHEILGDVPGEGNPS